jgi:hypothetical protein
MGPEMVEKYEGPQPSDLREWTILLRRLHLPYFEEGRSYLEGARADFYGGHNEFSFYSPDTLKEIIERYEDAE